MFINASNYFSLFKAGRAERGRERTPSRLQAQQGVPQRVQSHDPKMMNWAQIKRVRCLTNWIIQAPYTFPYKSWKQVCHFLKQNNLLGFWLGLFEYIDQFGEKWHLNSIEYSISLLWYISLVILSISFIGIFCSV